MLERWDTWDTWEKWAWRGGSMPGENEAPESGLVESDSDPCVRFL